MGPHIYLESQKSKPNMIQAYFSAVNILTNSQASDMKLFYHSIMFYEDFFVGSYLVVSSFSFLMAPQKEGF